MNTIWNEKHQRHIIEVSKLWGVMMFAKGFISSIDAVKENNALFRKIGKVFCKKLLEDVPQIHFYGFEVETTDSWKLFTAEEYWAITHLIKPIQKE